MILIFTQVLNPLVKSYKKYIYWKCFFYYFIKYPLTYRPWIVYRELWLFSKHLSRFVNDEKKLKSKQSFWKPSFLKGIKLKYDSLIRIKNETIVFKTIFFKSGKWSFWNENDQLGMKNLVIKHIAHFNKKLNLNLQTSLWMRKFAQVKFPQKR